MRDLWRLIVRILWGVVIVFTLLIIGFGILAVIQDKAPGILSGPATKIANLAKGKEVSG